MALKPYERIALATEAISKTTAKMEENLKILNDSNILHQEKSTQEHKAILGKLQELTSKYWYLVLVAFVLLALVAGVKEAKALLPTP